MPLPICVVKNGMRVRRTKPASPVVERGRLAAAPSITSGRSAPRIISAARSSAARCATGISIGCGGIGGMSAHSSPAMSSGNSRCTGPGRSCCATRNASRTIVGNGVRADDLPRHLGQRRHAGDDVDDLEARLLAGHDPLLAGDHDHRHGAELGVGGAGREIERAGAERRDANARLAGQPAVGRRHERRRLLVAGQDQLDRRAAQRFDDVEVLLAGHAENPLDALVLERGDQQVRALCHVNVPLSPEWRGA